jgi:hypothetical protein
MKYKLFNTIINSDIKKESFEECITIIKNQTITKSKTDENDKIINLLQFIVDSKYN